MKSNLLKFIGLLSLGLAQDAVTVTERIAEPDAAEMAEYRTGEPGWVEVEHTLPFNGKVPIGDAR
ncbi:MAG: hypothetical protein QGH61_10785 [Candidatus Marinimicrobia bacterium]|nr:hypothetical protein [Candidatus Neomarinimicrobiota bacterium]